MIPYVAHCADRRRRSGAQTSGTEVERSRTGRRSVRAQWRTPPEGEVRVQYYPEWIDFKSKETSYANACNLQSRWKRYFEHSTIVDIPFEKLTTGAIKKWCVDVIAEMHLTDRQFKDLKSIMNMIFDYAVSFDIIQINLSRQVRGFSDKTFKQEAENSYTRFLSSKKL